MKTNECNELRTQNRALMEENARQQAFIERLLRHQAFTPFLEDLSREESLEAKPAMPTLASSATPQPAPARKESNPFQGQQFGGVSQASNPQIGMAMVPEAPLDMSMLNINSGTWNANGSFNYQQPQVFAVTELPEGPTNPLDADMLSGKGYSSIFAAEDSADEAKADYPVIERPMISENTVSVEVEEDDEDPEFDLYRSSPAPTSSVVASAPLESHESLFGNISSEKVFAHFHLQITDEVADELKMARFYRQCARMEAVYQRIAALTSHLDS